MPNVSYQRTALYSPQPLLLPLHLLLISRFSRSALFSSRLHFKYVVTVVQGEATVLHISDMVVK